MKNAILRANDALYTTCIWVAGLSVAAIAIIIPLGVFGRYLLGSGARWSEPTATLLMMIFTFIGAAASYRAHAHMAVEMVTNRLPDQPRRICEWLVLALMGTISLFMVIWGGSLCMETWNQFSSALPDLRIGMTYLPVPVSGLITLIFVCEHAAFGSQSRRPCVVLDHHEIDCDEVA